MNLDFIYRGETQNLDAAARASAGGSFVHLSNGWTHYEIAGPDDGRPVILVHGFSVPYFIWEPTFRGLASAGFRPVRFDLYGRGHSDRPGAMYNLSFFVRQLLEIMDALKIPTADIAGLSMGGPIAAAFAVEQPARTRKLVLIDPLGPNGMPLGLVYRAVRVPAIGELVLGLAGTGHMIRGVASDFFDPTEVRLFQDRYREQMRYRGFKRAILSTLRNHMIDGSPDVYKRLGVSNIPVLLIWGHNDRTLPMRQSQSILELVPQAEFRAIADCGHVPHYEKPEIVNPLLIKFLEA